jgi:hypothetical protein
VHIVLATNERVIRTTKLNSSVIQTEKLQSADTNDVVYMENDCYDEMKDDMDIEEIM